MSSRKESESGGEDTVGKNPGIIRSEDGMRSMCVELPVGDPARVEKITDCVYRFLNKKPDRES